MSEKLVKGQRLRLSVKVLEAKNGVSTKIETLGEVYEIKKAYPKGWE